jgi:hypothetical protein
VILGWTVLRPSARERSLRALALAVAAGAAAALAGAAAFGDPRSPGVLAVAAAAAMLAVAVAARRPRGRAREVAVDPDGTVRLRLAGGAESLPAVCRYAAPGLITLRAGATSVPIWPDSVPREAFRRLSACVRWARAADSAGSSNDNNERG